MSGQAGGRGYLVQAVIAVLDSLQDRDWTECILEPTIGADKVDLVLRSSKRSRVSQIKSSQNAIGMNDIRRWACELEESYPNAEEYELRLIGPVTESATSARSVGKVTIPTPQALNIAALLEQCAHRLDGYLRELGYGPTRPRARELLAQALATKLGQFAASGNTLTRHNLEILLAQWVEELLPSDYSDNAIVPHQLPGLHATFVGRNDELQQLKSAIENEDVRAIVIRGLTGIGKSALAAGVAAQIENRYPDGQVYIDLLTADLSLRSQTHAVVEVIHAFKPTYPASGDTARCLSDFRTLLYDRRVLLLAENVDSFDQVVGLIPPTSKSLLIVTTQSRLELPGAKTLDLDVLSKEDGANLVRQITPRVAEFARTIADSCGHLPLAIKIACGTLNARPDLTADKYAERLFGVSERAKLVRAALDISFSYIPSDVRQLLSACSVFAGDFDMNGIAAILNLSDGLTDTQIGIALGRYLVEWDSSRDRYRLHDLVRAYIIEATEPTEREVFLTEHAVYYSSICEQVEELYRKGGDETFMALDLFDSEESNIAAGFSFCSLHASNIESAAIACTSFVRGLTHVMDLRLDPITRVQLLSSGMAAARQLKNLGLLVLHTGNLGRAYRELGELDRSLECQRWVLQMATKEGHLEDQAYALHHIGLVLLQQGAFLEGVDHLEQAIKLCQNVGLRLKTLHATSLGNLGAAFVQTNQPEMAVRFLRSALELTTDSGNVRFTAQTMSNLGIALVQTGAEPSLAIDLLVRAIEIATDLKDQRLVFAARAHLPDALASVNRKDEALTVAKLQQTEAGQAGLTKFEVDALQTVGELLLASGDVAAAESSFRAMLEIAKERGASIERRKSLASLADLAAHQGDHATAIHLQEQCLALATGIQEVARCKWNLGNLLAAAGQRDRAVAMMRDAIVYYENMKHESLDKLTETIRRIEQQSTGATH